MNPVIKTLSIIISTILLMFIVPFLLIIFHDYVNLFFAVVSILGCFLVFSYGMYHELYPMIQKRYIEEEEIFHSFHGDKNKIRFYKGFKKYFDGDLDKDGLQNYFEHHPSKH